MDSKRIALLTVAIVAIGIFALPGTVSLLSGQHTWYDISGGQNEVPCEKCHQDIADEMGSDDNGVHRKLTCAMCHRTLFKATYNPSTGQYESVSGYIYGSGNGSASTPGKDAHGAATIECMDCHAVNEFTHTLLGGFPYHHDNYEEYNYDYPTSCCKCHINCTGSVTGEDEFISAGGFGLTDRYSCYNDTGEKAAHLKFVLDAIDDDLMEGANEACIACHTRIGVNITWTKNTVLEFTAVEDDLGNWTLTDFQATGDNVTNTNYKNNWTNSY